MTRLVVGPERARPGGFRLQFCFPGAEIGTHIRMPFVASTVNPLVHGDTSQDPQAVESTEPPVPGPFPAHTHL